VFNGDTAYIHHTTKTAKIKKVLLQYLGAR